MIKLEYDKIVEKLKKEKGLSEEEISSKVKAKLEALAGLISKEGAVHIVANELGVKLFDNLGKEVVKINELLVGMRRVGIVGKVVNVSNVNTFKKDDKERKVGSFIVGDEGGRVKVVLWDDNFINKMESGAIKEDVIVKVENGYVKENNGFKEIHLNAQSGLVLDPEGVTIGSVADAKPFKSNRKEIKDLTENDVFVEVIGTVVQLFDPRFYNVCGTCGKKAVQDGESFKCEEHGDSVKSASVVNFSFDDGSGSIRVAAFRDVAEGILGINTEEMKDPAKFEEVKNKILGSQFILNARVSKNTMFNRVELIANGAKEVNPEELIAELKR